MGDYYTPSNTIGPDGTIAESSEVSNEFDLVETALDAVAVDTKRAIKLPASATDQLLNKTAGQRANLHLAFDANGDLTAVQPFGNYLGEWVTSKAFVAGDLVKVSPTPYRGSVYIAATPHTSGVFATDLANSRWTLVIDLSNQLSLNNQLLTTADTRFAATQGDDLLVDASTGRIDIDLPAAPSVTGGPITVTRATAEVGQWAVTITADAGDGIMGGADDMVLDGDWFSVRLMWSGTSDGWVMAAF